ncbi:MAG: hypothetical protein RI980_1598 [Bacteroidota bacterium]|jgi:hypothetical protein
MKSKNKKKINFLLLKIEINIESCFSSNKFTFHRFLKLMNIIKISNYINYFKIL